MDSQLFTGKLVRLAALEPEKDAEAFARWSRDAEYSRLSDAAPAHPFLAKSIQEEMSKWEERENGITFVIHTLADDRTIGFVELDGIAWTHGEAFVGIGIGERADWGRGYGTDAMRVLLRYAFTELNLHRLSLTVFEYNPRALRCYEKAGFVTEGRERQCLSRDGRRWDQIFMGSLKSEWEQRSHESQV